MGNKTAVRRLADLLMTVALILLMAYFFTGQEIHEWLGAGMLVVFLAHHILNRKWLRALNRGKYTPCRILYSLTMTSRPSCTFWTCWPWWASGSPCPTTRAERFGAGRDAPPERHQRDRSYV